MTIKNIVDAPNPFRGIYNPPAEMLYAEGYRIMPTIPEPADGYTRIAQPVAIDVDGINGDWDMTGCDRLTSELEAEAKAAREADFIAQGLIPKAQAFRALMRMYFGENAETNHAITQEVVAGYFLTTPDLTIQGVQHGMTLQALFVELSAWVNETPANTWNIPWSVVP